MSHQPVSTQRVFFALYPEPILRELLALEAAQHSATQSVVVADNLHLTLVFIGRANLAQCLALEQAASTINAEPFTLQINMLGHFHHKILWLGCRTIPAALHRLHCALTKRLQLDCAYLPEKRQYHPHITIQRLRDKYTEIPLAPSIEWQVNNFSLMLSTSSSHGQCYSELRHWRLYPAE